MGSSDERIVALLKEARHQLELERSRRKEPIAIVGIGCRFPGGGADPESFWRSLCEGVDASGEVPGERWDVDQYYDPDPATPGKAYTRRGAFLDRVDQFDAEFFGISPREAQGMDPQQRLLLELTWEALEDAGIPPDSLRGSATGVWVGLCVDDYARRTVMSRQSARIDAYNTLGNARSIAAGRISYVLDLRGPAVQLDTACSSSLVAVHQACQSLRLRETNLAVVGGVNLMLAPESTVALSKLRALAPDGRCKTFDASADGYGRGEGCAMVVLRRLSDARAAGDRIYAVVRGSAINHDGHSNGLTAPSGIAQEAVIRSALESAGVEARSVGYVEAHGTGTLLGDPIEVLALQRVYGQERPPEQPLLLGAVKTNLGHLEGAAGVAGLIKSALCLFRGQLPASLHFRTPNPKIPWSELAVRVVGELRPWPRGDTPRLASVSSFGISGTNAHAVLEEAPPAAEHPPARVRAAELVVLSAKTREALPAVAQRLREHLEAHPELALADIAFSLVSARTLQEHRLALPVTSRAALLTSLGTAAGRQLPPGASQTPPRLARRKLAWLFTGQGAQQNGMGKQLCAEWPAFRAAFEGVCEVMDPLLEVPLRDVMWADAGAGEARLLHLTGYTQPALFAFEWALAALWRSWGVTPEIVAGHSIGEITAACVAGVFSLADAARLVCARGRLMQALPAGGAMVSIGASEAEVGQALSEVGSSVAIAAVNTPSAVVISGEAAAVAGVAEQFARRGVPTKRLSVSHAFHSPLLDPMLDAFAKVAATVEYRAPELPLISNLSGALAGAEVATSAYWVRHAREVVRFADGVRALQARGVSVFVELGPKPTLLGLVAACLPESGPVLVPSLQGGRSEACSVLEALGSSITSGCSVDWRGVFAEGGRRVPLPSYPWQHQRYWVDALPDAPGERPQAPGGTTGDEPEHSPWYRLAWRPAVSEREPRSPTGRWLIIDTGIAGAPVEPLLRQLRARGVTCERVRLDALAACPPADSALCVWPAADDAAAAQRFATDALAIVQALAGKESPPRLCWLTLGAIPVRPAEGCAVAPSVLWGLARTVAYEHPELRCLMIDVESEEQLAEAALRELGASGVEGQVAWRGEQRYVARLVRALAVPALPPEANYGLVSGGSLDALAVVQRERSEPAAGHVEIEVEAAGVNFRDVLTAGGGVAAEPLGRECAGVVRAVGAGVQNVRVGEQVMALTAGAFGRFVQADARLVAAIPPGMLARDAAAVPVAFTTAYYALRELAKLQAGETVLIHAAAGGVGLAAIQVAQALGARVLATASPEKWPLLRALGVTRLASSRDPQLARAFAEERGSIHVVLNSLTGDFVDASLELLHPRGRFIELGTTDVRDRAELARELPGITYHAFDLSREPAPLLAELLARVARAFDAGELAPLATRGFPIGSADVVLQHMAQGGHVGKLALLPLRPAQPLRAEGTVLITGGLGALGLQVARALVELGVVHLLLTGRRGTLDGSGEQVVASLRARGAQITVAAVDVSDPIALARVLDELPAERPLRGVVHAAGVLRDGMLGQQSASTFRDVLAAKVAGAWHLHRLTQHRELDFFVLFSSLAGTLGAARLGAYASANAYLDALAMRRRADGLPATSLAWGPWSGSGMAAAATKESEERAGDRGVLPIEPESGRALLAQALRRDASHVIIAPLLLDAVGRSFEGNVPALWLELVARSAQDSDASSPANELRDELARLRVQERPAYLRRWLVARCAVLLGHAEDRALDLQRGFFDLGMDSLMILKLRQQLERALGRRVSPSVTFSYPNIDALAEHLLEADAAADAPASAAERPEPSSPEPEAVELATDEDVLDFINSRFEADK